MSASPVRHGIRQPVIKITANSATSSSPVARALFQLESQGTPMLPVLPGQGHTPHMQGLCRMRPSHPPCVRYQPVTCLGMTMM